MEPDNYVPKYIHEEEEEEKQYIRCTGCSKQLPYERNVYAPGIDYYCTLKCKLEWEGH